MLWYLHALNRAHQLSILTAGLLSNRIKLFVDLESPFASTANDTITYHP